MIIDISYFIKYKWILKSFVVRVFQIFVISRHKIAILHIYFILIKINTLCLNYKIIQEWDIIMLLSFIFEKI